MAADEDESMNMAIEQTAPKKALLVICFGTSYSDAREKSISATENALACSFPEYDFHRAFTSRKVIEKVAARDGLVVEDVGQAIERLAREGYREVLVQPLHVIAGIEFEKILAGLAPYCRRFDRLDIGHPLLSDPEDFDAVVKALCDELPVRAPAEAVVLMGHGSRHFANSAYTELDQAFATHQRPDVRVATVEGTPSLGDLLLQLKVNGVRRVTLMPFLLVAGEHARNDMAGISAESWKNILERQGFQVVIRMQSLGEMSGVHRLYVAHARAALRNECR
jgi:sirohydrochlorin cobaltochelatase